MSKQTKNEPSEMLQEAMRRARLDAHNGKQEYKPIEPERRSFVIRLSEHEIELLLSALWAHEKRYKTFAKSCDNGYGKATSECKKEAHLNTAQEIRDIAGFISEALM